MSNSIIHAMNMPQSMPVKSMRAPANRAFCGASVMQRSASVSRSQSRYGRLNKHVHDMVWGKCWLFQCEKFELDHCGHDLLNGDGGFL